MAKKLKEVAAEIEARSAEVMVPEVIKQDVSIEAILTQAIDKGVPVETLERLMTMRRELKAEWAKEEFDKAMAKFQSECPTIVKTKEVSTRDGRVAYRYAPIESIVSQVKDALQRNGFSYSTDQELKDTGVKVTVTVTHSAGHSKNTTMEVPFGTKTQVMSDSQVSAAATTFAKRYAFCNAFGILTGDEDTDAKKVDDYVGGVVNAAEKARPIIDRTDEPFTSKPAVDPAEAKKTAVAGLLLQLGHDVRKLGGLSSNAMVKTLSGLDMTRENHDEIISRLEVLVEEKKAPLPAEDEVTYD